MIIEQLYTKCLAHGAYYIESNKEAAIIDPLREVDPYLEMANERGAKIKYIFETHFHADFVSGHVDLAQKTGAPIVFGPTTMKTGFSALVAEDGQEFILGNVTVKLIHTPGHTPESSCFLLLDEQGKQTALFSGDTLFIGDVGRPDLAQKVIAELTQDKLASMLYDSLREKILPLNDDLIVYPGHGAGSACGKNMSNETTDTLGNQKKTNYALNTTLSREEFVAQVLDGLTEPPGYFPYNVLMNIGGYDSIEDVVNKGTTALSIEQLENHLSKGETILLDTRDAETFAKGHIPGSYNIGIDGNFATWVGTIFQNVKQSLFIIAEEGREQEVTIRLARIGFDNCQGYLEGGVAAWKESGKPLNKVERINPHDLTTLQGVKILDVRKKSEFDSQHVFGAVNLPLDNWQDHLIKLSKTQRYYVHCAGGYRSMIFISILRSFGFTDLVDVRGGFSKILETTMFPVTEYVCPTTLL